MGIISYGGAGLPLTLRGLATNSVSLAAGAVYTIPSGKWLVTPGLYSAVQFKDPVSGVWRLHQVAPGASVSVTSDGANYRVANLTGCVAGARLTNAGSGYTSAPVVAFSSGGATATAVMGQVVSTTVTITSGGANYSLPPVCVIDAPAAGGLPAKATATISGGAVTAITITDQGAGYGNGPASVTATTMAPNITILPNPADPNLNSVTTPITTATATLALDSSSAGTVNAVLVNTHGTPLTSVPTISFSGGGGSGAAATALMCLAVTAQTVSGGSGYVVPVLYRTSGGVLSTAAAYTTTLNPYGVPRSADGTISLSGGALSAVTIQDGGLFQAVPSGMALQNGTVTAGTISTPTVGGVSDSFVIQGS